MGLHYNKRLLYILQSCTKRRYNCTKCTKQFFYLKIFLCHTKRCTQPRLSLSRRARTRSKSAVNETTIGQRSLGPHEATVPALGSVSKSQATSSSSHATTPQEETPPPLVLLSSDSTKKSRSETATSLSTTLETSSPLQASQSQTPTAFPRAKRRRIDKKQINDWIGLTTTRKRSHSPAGMTRASVKRQKACNCTDTCVRENLSVGGKE